MSIFSASISSPPICFFILFQQAFCHHPLSLHIEINNHLHAFSSSSNISVLIFIAHSGASDHSVLESLSVFESKILHSAQFSPCHSWPLLCCPLILSSVQFSSVAQSCPTLCDPMNCSTPGLPVHHQFPEFTQTHVHRVSDAIQPSHPLSSPSPPAHNPSQHQNLFQ